MPLQVPLQNNAEDWKLGNLSCYDSACVARLQTKLKLDFRGIAEGTPRDCLNADLGQEHKSMLVSETLKADPDALGRLMADHTQVSHADTSAPSLALFLTVRPLLRAMSQQGAHCIKPPAYMQDHRQALTTQAACSLLPCMLDIAALRSPQQRDTKALHVQIDWRPLLPRISIPCLLFIGCKNGVFPPQGTAVVSQLVPKCNRVSCLHSCMAPDL